MKLICDLCGGALQMNMGGQDATCKSCGLVYPLARLKEKLGLAQPSTPQKTEPVNPVITPPKSPVAEEPVEIPVIEEAAEAQFVMQVEKLVDGYLMGRVQSGSIGLGETVYINHDYSTSYTIYDLGKDSGDLCVKAGAQVELRLASCPRSMLKTIRVLTGDKTPAENAYHFPGTVNEYFTDLLQRKFTNCTVRTQITWHGLEMPVNYLLLQNGLPKVAVMVFDSHDAKARYQAEKAAQIFGQVCIGFTHFYSDYRNDAQYVVDRIQSVMG